jgi:2-methylcitrate dehydratase PrpD
MLAELTIDRVLALAPLPRGSLSKEGRGLAGLSLFDWRVVGKAGSAAAVSAVVRGLVAEEGGRPAASVFGSSVKVLMRAPALANGAISHALDYDDKHFTHIGQLSVGVAPAALAIGEAADATAAAMRDAFLFGAEAACRVGVVLGRAHHERGFHQAATARMRCLTRWSRRANARLSPPIRSSGSRCAPIRAGCACAT